MRRVLILLLVLLSFEVWANPLHIAIDLEGTLVKRIPVSHKDKHPADNVIIAGSKAFVLMPGALEALEQIVQSKDVKVSFVHTDPNTSTAEMQTLLTNIPFQGSNLGGYKLHSSPNKDLIIDLNTIESYTKDLIYLSNDLDKVTPGHEGHKLNLGPYRYAFPNFAEVDSAKTAFGANFDQHKQYFPPDEASYNLEQERWRAIFPLLREVYKHHAAGKPIADLKLQDYQLSSVDPNEDFSRSLDSDITYRWKIVGSKAAECERYDEGQAKVIAKVEIDLCMHYLGASSKWFAFGEGHLCGFFTENGHFIKDVDKIHCYGDEQKKFLELKESALNECSQSIQCLDRLGGYLDLGDDLTKILAAVVTGVNREARQSLEGLQQNYKALLNYEKRLDSPHFKVTQRVQDLIQAISAARLKCEGELEKHKPPSNDGYFEQLLKKPFSSISLEELLVLWYPDQERALDKNFYDGCGRTNGNPFERSGSYIADQCSADTVYRWSDKKYLDLFSDTMPDKKTWKPALPKTGTRGRSTIYATMSPASTHGFGPIGFRIKLKPGVKFNLNLERDCTTWNSTQLKTEVGHRTSIWSDVYICGTDSIESWSYNTREYYDEIVKEWKQAKAGGPTAFNYHSSCRLATRCNTDGYTHGPTVMKQRLYDMAKNILAGNGGIFTRPGEEHLADEHFKTSKPYYANEE